MKLRLLAFAFALLCGSPAFAANPTIEVWKSTTCECCGNWGGKADSDQPLLTNIHL